MKNDNQRVVLPSGDDYRVELFSKNPERVVDQKYPSFKLGQFRAKQADNEMGERYFITDLIEEGVTPDVVMVHDDTTKKHIKTYGLEPAYVCGRLEIYRVGLYQSHALYSLKIDSSEIRLINKFD